MVPEHFGCIHHGVNQRNAAATYISAKYSHHSVTWVGGGVLSPDNKSTDWVFKQLKHPVFTPIMGLLVATCIRIMTATLCT